ncbi:MAG: S8 family serine peptidase, partial [Phycisphaerales bacterium]|nr:S8 family serine peptidase [Phycisphaerales bacterium]
LQTDGTGIFLYTNPGDIESDYAEAIHLHGADIANNSIGTNVCGNLLGCDITGDYGVTSMVIDAIVAGALGDPYRIVWANGNERGCGNCCLVSPGGYHSTAPPAGAKNHITVGALNSNDDSVTAFTSWGPTDDGRLKPDISAPGCQTDDDVGVTSCSSTGGYRRFCGTSMATPTVTGLAALLLQDYRLHYPGQRDPRNSTLKVLLAHTAVDLGNPGPDYQSGFGSVRIVPAIDAMRIGAFLEAAVGQNQTHVVNVFISNQDAELRATLAWDDPFAAPNVDGSLVNNLDIVIHEPGSNIRHYSWTLEPARPELPAARNRADDLNNIEQVLVDDPVPGLWRIEIHGSNVPIGPQVFSLCVTPSAGRDCNGDGIPDADQIAGDPGLDCAVDGILDECEPDCNGNAAADSCDLLAGTALDCDGNGIPDNCDPFRDCNGNGVFDACDLAQGMEADCNGNSVPDRCEDPSGDCNGNVVPDSCEWTGGSAVDCDFNGILDECDIVQHGAADCQSNGIPDICELDLRDCNNNVIPDDCDLVVGVSADLDRNGVPDECEIGRLYVRSDANGLNLGTNWADAFADLQSALRIAARAENAVTEIWVATGRYSPAPPGGSRGATFRLAAGVSLYGGFAGNETTIDQRDPVAFPTILSGDLLGDDDSDDDSDHDGDNVYRVVTAVEIDAPVTFDGFVVSGGRTAEDLCAPFAGGGMYVSQGSMRIAHCTFVHNFAVFGGALYIEVGSPTVEACTFVENEASQHGGAVASANLGSLLGNPLVNGDDGFLLGGGPIFDDGGDPVFHNCTFTNNSAHNGGAAWFGGGKPAIRNCVFQANRVTGAGGAVNNWGADLQITAASFVANSSAANGGAMAHLFSAHATLVNCVFFGNRAERGGAMHNGDDLTGAQTPVSLSNCAFGSNRAILDGGAILHAANAPAELVNCTIAFNVAGRNGGGVRTLGGVQDEIHNSILWANRDMTGITYASQWNSNAGPAHLSNSCVDALPVEWGLDGNFASNPLLVNPRGVDGAFGTPDDNLRLSGESPCIDAADSSFLPADGTDVDADGDSSERLPWDADGFARFLDDPFIGDARDPQSPVVDIGAYEAGDCDRDGVSDAVAIAFGDAGDCDDSRTPDACDLADGSALDCNANAIPDVCDHDCNCNGIDDSVDIATGRSVDCGGNGIPDECEPDCNDDGLADSCNIFNNDAVDCNADGVPDSCALADGTGADCNLNGTPDECDLESGHSGDCDADGVLDDCQDSDCNSNGLRDACDLASGFSADCNANAVPDECDIIRSAALPGDTCAAARSVCPGFVYRASTEGAAVDGCAECSCEAPDVWYVYTPSRSGVLTVDLCGSTFDTALSFHASCGLIGAVELTCNDNACGLQSVATIDVLARRKYFVRVSGAAADDYGAFRMTLTGPPCSDGDCDANGVPDFCDIQSGRSTDVFPAGGDGVPDQCQSDCNANGTPDLLDATAPGGRDCNRNGLPDGCDLAAASSDDCDGDAVPDECRTALVVLAGGDINAGFADAVESAGHTLVRVSADAIPASLSAYDVVVLERVGVSAGADLMRRVDSFVAAGGGLVLINSFPGYLQFHGRASPLRHLGPATVRTGTEVVDPTSPLAIGLPTHSALTGRGTMLELKPRASVALAWTADDAPLVVTYPYHFGRVVYVNDSGATQAEKTWSGDVPYGRQLLANILNYVGTPRRDCNRNGALDVCETAAGRTADTLPAGGDGIPDECQTDCNLNGFPDRSEAAADCDRNYVLDDCEIQMDPTRDCNQDGRLDDCDTPLRILVAGRVNPGFVAGLEDLPARVSVTVFDAFLPGHSLTDYDVLIMALNDRQQPMFCYDTIDEFVQNGGGLVLFQSRPWFASALCDADPAADVVGFVERSGLELVSFDSPLARDLPPSSPISSLTVAAGLNPGARIVIKWSQDGAPMAATYDYGLGRVVYVNAAVEVLEDWDDDVRFGRILMRNAVQLVASSPFDCNGNLVLDDCDIQSGASFDVLPSGGNLLPDECESDCNANLVYDVQDIAAGRSADCNADGVPDECQADCDGNGIADECDLSAGLHVDENGNGIPDACDACVSAADCRDGDVCTLDHCYSGHCDNRRVEYGDVDGNGSNDVFDILCVLDGFAGVCPTTGGCDCDVLDLAPCRTGDGLIDVFDILGVLEAFGGVAACDCPSAAGS